EEFALAWRDTLRRDGFLVASIGDGHSGMITYDRKHAVVRLRANVAHEFTCDLSGIKKPPVLRRIERVFLASGAYYNLSAFEPEPAQLLYRCNQDAILGLLDGLANLRVSVDATERQSFGGADIPEAEPYLVGRISREKHSVALETGPAFDHKAK